MIAKTAVAFLLSAAAGFSQTNTGAITGIVTLISLPKRRIPGLLTTAGGAVMVLAIYWLLVPR